MKRICLLGLMYLIPMLSSTILASDFEINGVFYNIIKDADCELEVTYKSSISDKSYSGDVIIPQNVTYNGIAYKVTSIGAYAFYQCSKLSTVSLPESITSILGRAFCECSSLKSINVPNSVSFIGAFAFYGCSNLVSINIPPNVSKIYDSVFERCTSLSAVDIPDGVTKIGIRAFSMCSSLTEITIPGSVKEMEVWDACYAFSSCTSLKTIIIEEGVGLLGNQTFYGCTNVETVICKNQEPIASNRSFVHFAKNATLYVPKGCKSKFANTEGWEDFKDIVEMEEIPVESFSLSITSTDNGFASYNGTPIRNKTSSFTVKEGTSATITFNPDKGYRIGSVKVNNQDVSSQIENNTYTLNINSDITIDVSFNLFEVGGITFEYISNTTNSLKVTGKISTYTGDIVIPETVIDRDVLYTVKTIDEDAFYGDTDITSISIPKTIDSIMERAFWGCDNLKTVNITSIESWCKIGFERLDSNPLNFAEHLYVNGNEVSEIIIPDGIKYIYEWAFCNFKGIKSLTLPSTLTHIYKHAFGGCRNLELVTSKCVNPPYFDTDYVSPFSGISSTAKLIVPKGSLQSYKSISRWNDYFAEITEEKDILNISITASGNGSATYENTTIRNQSKLFSIEEGSSATILFTPDAGYRIKSVKVNNSTISVSDNKYTINSINSNTTVSVEFEAIPPTTYTLSITASGSGSASYNNTTIRSKTSTFTVNEGTSATITFSPDAGYRIKSVKVNNSTVSVSNNQYTISSINSNTTVSVEFEAIPPTTYTLSITASGNGSASFNNTTIRSKTSTFTVNEGTSATISFSPDAGYRIKSVKVNNSAVSVSNNQYTISSINANTSVSVEFEAIPPTTYTLSITASGNGSASYNNTTIRSKTSTFTVNEGASAAITFSPDTGYRIKSVKVNNSAVSVSNNQYTISSINANTSVSVEFEAIPPTTYTLSITASGNGSASYNNTTIRSKTSTFIVNEGTSATIAFSPDAGYRIKSVKVNNSTVSVSNNQYTVSSIKSNTTVSVEFEAIPPTTYTLSITASGNGWALYNNMATRSTTSTYTVNEGSSATITFSPDTGYRIKVVKVNGSTVSVSDNKYTVSNIKANTTVSVEFEAIPITTYTLSITVSGNGSASYNNTTIRSNTSTFTVNEGTSATISFSPDAGYRIKSVKINNWMVSISDSQYIISNIKANMSVSVEFEAIPPTTYTLSITASGNGSASYDNTTIRSKTSTFTVNEGTSVTISFSPDAGYRIKELKVNNSTVSVSNNQYTISSINANTTISVEFEAIPPTTYALSITASGSGSASYNNTTIRNNTSTFTVNEGTSATISFSPDAGYRIKSVKVNNWMVSVSDSQYIISDIKSNKSVEVEFVEDVKSFSINDVHYSVLSYDDRTVKVTAGNFGMVLEIPEKVTYKDLEWNVTGIEDDIILGNKELAAIIWNPSVEFKASVSNPNLLLYVKSASYAPSTINNVIVNDIADNIVLTDAVSGNNFYCPKEFTAKKISYTHNYGMTTGIGESRGWETIALPFDVKTIAHSSKGELTPFANRKSGDTAKPFWLMSYGAGGWSNASSIKANTPYIISMPNNPDYKQEYRINGSITFSAEDVKVKKSDDLQTGSYNGNTFMPNFTNAENSGCLALNVNNDYVTYNGGSAEGSRFIVNLRPVHPFEAYMTSVSGARKYISINEDMTTGIEDISVMLDDTKGQRVYDLKGQLIISDTDRSIDEIRKSLPAGVYIVNGKKLIIK